MNKEIKRQKSQCSFSNKNKLVYVLNIVWRIKNKIVNKIRKKPIKGI